MASTPLRINKWLLAGGLAVAAVAAGLVLLLPGGDDKARSASSATTEITLTASRATVALGDRKVVTWAFNGKVPGPEIRLKAGEVVRATVRNDLPAPLTIHWHGVALRNDMDGVEGVTQKAIPSGGTFVYEFTAPDPGTYFYHPHTGTQLDRGLYAPLIVEDPKEIGLYDRELTVVLDDWTDGVGQDPDAILARLKGGMQGTNMSGGSAGTATMGQSGGAAKAGGTAMPGMDMSGGANQMPSPAAADAKPGPLGDDTGDVKYPFYLINGRPPSDPAVYDVAPGERVRLRLINAASDTPFRVGVGDQRLSVIATDGFPVRPVATDSILLGMGERYDAVVTAASSGSLPLVAQAEGKAGRALAVLRSGGGALPGPAVRAPSLDGRLLSLSDLRAARSVALEPRTPDRTFRIVLKGSMADYRWRLQTAAKLAARDGERVRLVFENRTKMWHPMHLHGQTFQVRSGTEPGPRKDTVIVPAGKTVAVDFDADNPGRWLIHCHNIYHAEAGMTTEFRVGSGPFFQSSEQTQPGATETMPDGAQGSGGDNSMDGMPGMGG